MSGPKVYGLMNLGDIAILAVRKGKIAMITRRCQAYLQVVLVAFLLNAAGMLLSVGYAQVTTNITSSGLGTTVSQAGVDVEHHRRHTARNGSNLFHSFGSLNVGAGNTANFCNAAACGVRSR